MVLCLCFTETKNVLLLILGCSIDASDPVRMFTFLCSFFSVGHSGAQPQVWTSKLLPASLEKPLCYISRSPLEWNLSFLKSHEAWKGSILIAKQQKKLDEYWRKFTKATTKTKNTENIIFYWYKTLGGHLKKQQQK